jgi:uncharacterized membrane protein
MTEPRWVEPAVSHLLRGGVIASIAVVVAGLVLTFVHHPDYVSSRPALGRLTAAEQPFPHTVSAVAEGVKEGHGQAVVMLGLLLLIATPVARVALSVGIFAVQGDRLYLAITTAVLLLLAASFVVGAAG